jgi:hypothetical protein
MTKKQTRAREWGKAVKELEKLAGMYERARFQPAYRGDERE